MNKICLAVPPYPCRPGVLTDSAVRSSRIASKYPVLIKTKVLFHENETTRCGRPSQSISRTDAGPYKSLHSFKTKCATPFTPRTGEHPDLIPLFKIHRSDFLRGSPKNHQATLAAPCCSWAVLQGGIRSLSQILMALLSLQSYRHRMVWLRGDL